MCVWNLKLFLKIEINVHCLPSSLQSVDFEAVAITVKELVRYARSVNPNHHSWLIIQADIYFGEWEVWLLCVLFSGTFRSENKYITHFITILY